jgi:hypothetical protein
LHDFGEGVQQLLPIGEPDEANIDSVSGSCRVDWL